MRIFHLLPIALLLLAGCDALLGEKKEITEFVKPPNFSPRVQEYVPIRPEIDGARLNVDGPFRPVHISTGFDELMYVVSSGEPDVIGDEKIIAVDQSGNPIPGQQLEIRGAKYAKQDRSLDLLVIGSTDTTIDNRPFELTTLFRLDMSTPDGSLSLKDARIEKKMVYPFIKGFQTNSLRNSKGEGIEAVSFNGLTIRHDNSYFVTSSGPGQDQFQIPPDNAVLDFRDDTLFTFVRLDNPGGNGSGSNWIDQPTDITVTTMPPQRATLVNGDSRDFLVTTLDTTTELPQVRFVEFVSDPAGGRPSVNIKNLPQDTAKAEGYLYQPGKLAFPRGITYTGDGTNHIFVVSEDSLHQFNSNGLEGVQPPVGSEDRSQLTKVSFGGTGSGIDQFRNPHAVAYARQTVWVADTDNQRLLRFKLSTDFN